MAKMYKKRNKIYSAVLAISFFADESFYTYSISLVKPRIVTFFAAWVIGEKIFQWNLS